MVAQLTDLEPGEFVHTLGDAHLYLNHLDQARLQLTRTPHPLPTMRITAGKRSIDEFDVGDFELRRLRRRARHPGADRRLRPIGSRPDGAHLGGWRHDPRDDDRRRRPQRRDR